MTNLSHGKLGNDADQYAVYGEDGRAVAVTYDDADGRLAGLFAVAPELLEVLVELELAGSNRENTMGDVCTLLDCKAVLESAVRKASSCDS